MAANALLDANWHAPSGVPVVFLHGLLGSQADWHSVIAQLKRFDLAENLQENPKIRPLTIDLPCHGESRMITCDSREMLCEQLHHTLQHHLGDQPFYLVGYSLGGRMALQYKTQFQPQNLLGCILEGANIGLATEAERQQRWQNDCHWANRFRSEPLASVLADWYQQPVFHSLNETERSQLIAERSHNFGCHIAQMLEATSLATQPLFHDFSRCLFLVGEQDSKFRQQAEQYQLPYQLIQQAGHNSHRANPKAFMQKIHAIVSGEISL